MSVDVAKLEAQARVIRGDVVRMSHKAQTAHLASALSCVDILTAIYWSAASVDPKKSEDPDRDRVILSKGHAATALYATLARRGFCSPDILDTFNDPGGKLAEHPSPHCIPGVEAATGSLGHGLSLGLGMALAARIQKKSYRVFAVMSDGECEEGSVWEAAMFASAQKLDRVLAIIDYNKWQATGRSNEIMALESLRKKWEAFNWSAYEIDGHDMRALTQALSNFPDKSGKPVAIIANTVKGKGVSFMEDDNNWHYRAPTAEELGKALVELKLK